MFGTMLERCRVAKKCQEPFGEIMTRLAADKPELLGNEPIVSAIGLKRIERKYNSLLHVELRSRNRWWRGYIKVCKPRGERTDPDWPAPGPRVQREYDFLCKLDRFFGADPMTRTVRPVACYVEYPAIITEEAPGVDGLTVLKSSQRFFSGMSATKLIEDVCFRCGTWLSKFQRYTASDAADRFSLGVMRTYNDRRLQTLARTGFRGFGEAERGKTLRLFDRLAESIADRELNVVGVHGDFSLGNVLVSSKYVTVMDFPTFTTGSPFHDLTYFYDNLQKLALSWRCRALVIAHLSRDFLAGYGEDVDVLAPMFRLFQLQHVLCNLSSMATQRKWPWWRRWGRRCSYYYRLERRHFLWLRQQWASPAGPSF